MYKNYKLPPVGSIVFYAAHGEVKTGTVNKHCTYAFYSTPYIEIKGKQTSLHPAYVFQNEILAQKQAAQYTDALKDKSTLKRYLAYEIENAKLNALPPEQVIATTENLIRAYYAFKQHIVRAIQTIHPGLSSQQASSLFVKTIALQPAIKEASDYQNYSQYARIMTEECESHTAPTEAQLAFAKDTLQILESNPAWSLSVLDQIANCAKDLGLAKDVDGSFQVEEIEEGETLDRPKLGI